MKLAGALVLLGAALLLTSGGDGGICPVIEKDVEFFLHGTPEDYINFVKNYKNDPEILKSTESIKKCVDSTLTEDDKNHATIYVEKINSSSTC